jgi:hypothetical protein
MGSIIDKDAMPAQFPTHVHEPKFWEALGRVVATFGFLEETLAKAIFALTGTKSYSDDAVSEAFEKWLPKLEKALSDTLNPLIVTFGKAVKDHQDANIENFDELLIELRKAAEIRNVLCHGSWRAPNENGASLPFYMNREKLIFDSAIDCSFLNQVQAHAHELICEVINTVTHMGWQFPSSNGPGEPVFKNDLGTRDY